MSARQTLRDWLRFNAVGLAGVAVQLVLLAVFRSGFGWSVPASTALAVELTVVHNFIWHERWTWAYRGLGMGGWPLRLLRFNLGNGLVSIVGNLALMELLAFRLGLNYAVSNLVAIGACALVNFFISDRLVFTKTFSARA